MVRIFSVCTIAVLLVACGGNDDDLRDAVANEPVIGNAAQGETLYMGTTIGAASAPGCVTCHSLEEGVRLVGPSHADLGTRAQTAVGGQSAEDFLRESIVDPDAHITPGFSAGAMYQNYGNDLTEQQIADLIAFLRTLR